MGEDGREAGTPCTPCRWPHAWTPPTHPPHLRVQDSPAEFAARLDALRVPEKDWEWFQGMYWSQPEEACILQAGFCYTASHYTPLTPLKEQPGLIYWGG